MNHSFSLASSEDWRMLAGKKGLFKGTAPLCLTMTVGLLLLFMVVFNTAVTISDWVLALSQMITKMR